MTSSKNSKTKSSNKNSKTKSSKVQEVQVQETNKPQTIGAFTKLLILQGLSVKEVEKQIKTKFPECRAQINSIYFYRSKLHKSGQLKKA